MAKLFLTILLVLVPVLSWANNYTHMHGMLARYQAKDSLIYTNPRLETENITHNYPGLVMNETYLALYYTDGNDDMLYKQVRTCVHDYYYTYKQVWENCNGTTRVNALRDWFYFTGPGKCFDDVRVTVNQCRTVKVDRRMISKTESYGDGSSRGLDHLADGSIVEWRKSSSGTSHFTQTNSDGTTSNWTAQTNEDGSETTTKTNPDGSTTVKTTTLNEDGSKDITEEITFPGSTDKITKQTHISAADEDGNTTETLETASSSYDVDGNLIGGEKTTVTTTNNLDGSTSSKEETEIYNPETGQWECHPTETSSCDGDTGDGDTGGGGSNGGGSGPPECEEKTWYKDADGDGYTDGTTGETCEAPSGYVAYAQPGDCNDDPVEGFSINPGAPEVCDGDDNNCNGQEDEGVKTTWYLDADDDGYYPASGTIEACEAPSTNYVAYAQPNDCNDIKGKGEKINPGEPEQCDNIDHNCDKVEYLATCGSSTKQCGASAYNIAVGALSHNQNLGSSLILYYESLIEYDGPLGASWTHSYDISLQELENGSVFFWDGDSSPRYYKSSNGGYVSQAGDYSALSKTADGWLLTEKNGTLYSFDADGNASATTDRNGNTTTFAYEGGRLSSVTGLTGKVTNFITDNDGLIGQIVDPEGRSYKFYYDADNNLIEVTYPQADGTTASWTYTYYGNNLMETKTDVSAYTVTYIYDDQGRILKADTSEGENYTLAYNSDIARTEMSKPDGGEWSFNYDTRLGVMIEKTDPEENTSSYEYDENRNLASLTDPDGGVTAYTYDEYGNMASESDAIGSTTTYTYNQNGQVLSITDTDGSSSSYEYDDKGNLTSTTDASGATTSYEYDSKGNVIKITDTTGGETLMSYDGSNNLTSVTDTSGATTSFEYDTAGNMVSQTDAQGSSTAFEYSSLNQLVKATDPQGKATSYSYDRSGNRTSQTDANGNTTYYEYNHKGQVVKVTDALGGETKYTYGGTSCSACGSKGDNLTSITDAKGNTTKFEYDHLSRLVKEIGPLGYSTGYGYDAKGRLTSKTDAEGNTINYNYDALGRLLGKSYPDNTGESYSYDVKGNLLMAVNQNMGYSLSYDAGNRATSVTDSNGRAISYSYDTSGRKTKMTGPNGEEIAYSYDDSKRLSTIASDAGDFIFSYNSLGRRVGLSYPHGASASYSYDTSGRLTDLIHKTSGGSVIASNSYSHDNVGNRLSNENHDRTAEYAYDLVYRLTEAHYNTPGFSTNDSHSKGKGKGKSTGNSNAIANQAEIYSYDPVGNRLASQKNNTYSYNAANQLVIENGTTYIYDKNGNMIQKAGSDEFASYFYDYENRLIKVERTKGSSVIVANYKYDPFGRRIEKKVTENGSTTTTRFFYDNEDILFEYDENGSIGNRYVHGPGIDEPLALIQRKGNYYYHADGLGSIVAITDESAKVVQDYDYYYFGELKNQKNRIKQPYKYTGREWDKETGLYLYRARYYDPEIGRFTQKDPIGFAGGINHFGYVGQNPINWIDPWGLATYVVNRVIGEKGALPMSDNYSHTYVATTDSQGKVTSTYSWGNYYSPDGFLQTKWAPPSQKGDVDAAQEAINKNMAYMISDGFLDPYVVKAYNELSKSDYETWHPWDSCKHKARDLIERSLEIAEGK